MSLVTDHTEKLHTHVDELEAIDLISENEAGRFRDRIDALEGDLEMAYNREALHE